VCDGLYRLACEQIAQTLIAAQHANPLGFVTSRRVSSHSRGSQLTFAGLQTRFETSAQLANIDNLA